MTMEMQKVRVSDVLELRRKTGCRLNDCADALRCADGSIKTAEQILRVHFPQGTDNHGRRGDNNE